MDVLTLIMVDRRSSNWIHLLAEHSNYTGCRSNMLIMGCRYSNRRDDKLKPQKAHFDQTHSVTIINVEGLLGLPITAVNKKITSNIFMTGHHLK